MNACVAAVSVPFTSGEIEQGRKRTKERGGGEQKTEEKWEVGNRERGRGGVARFTPSPDSLIYYIYSHFRSLGVLLLETRYAD